MKVRALVLSLLLPLFAAGCAGGVPEKASPDDPSGNFHSVSSGLWRGGRPDEPGVARLAELGVRTIVNLENEMDVVGTERAWAESHGIRFVSSPMDGTTTPDDAQVDEVVRLLGDAAQGPFFVHCKKGMDRTGAIIAIHRVANERWLASDAYDEMRAMGFNGLLFSLKEYVKHKLGLDD